MDNLNSTTPDLTPFREQYSYYAKKLLSDLGLGELPQPERGQLLGSIELYTQQVIVNALLENLEGADAEEANQILDEQGGEAVIGYLIATIPNIEIKMADALAEAYARMLTEAKQLSDALKSTAPIAGSST